MRWNEPFYGDIRIVKKFLLFPKTINNEPRWLEIAYIKQFYSYSNYWKDEKWIDKGDKTYD